MTPPSSTQRLSTRIVVGRTRASQILESGDVLDGSSLREYVSITALLHDQSFWGGKLVHPKQLEEAAGMYAEAARRLERELIVARSVERPTIDLRVMLHFAHFSAKNHQSFASLRDTLDSLGYTRDYDAALVDTFEPWDNVRY